MTTTTYDALSRPVEVLDGGGGEVDTSYSGNDVLQSVAAASPENAKQKQSHDDLGRIWKVDCGSAWDQTFAMDPYGNVAKTASVGTSFSASFDIANQITTGSTYAGVYDSDGNLTSDPSLGSTVVNTFDAEGKATTFKGVTVVYDALGRAVEATSGSATAEFLYGPSGSKLAVMDGQTVERADIPLPGGGEAVYAGATLEYYRHADGLGSSRLASTPSQTLYSSTAYAPYGEVYSEAGTTDRSFTGQKQDMVSGQYDFLMRELSSTQGRWWTPDPSGLAAVNPNNPQSWNRYGYVNGMPLGMTDPWGLQPCSAKLHLDCGQSADGANAVGGPYDDGASGEQADDGDCGSSGGQTQECMLDGAEIDCGLMWGLGAGGDDGGGGGGVSDAIGNIAECTWSDCMGMNGALDSDGNPRQFMVGWDQCTGTNCNMVGYAVVAGSVASCGVMGGACGPGIGLGLNPASGPGIGVGLNPASGAGGGFDGTEIGTPKNASQCSIYQDGSTSGAGLYTLCSKVFPNGPVSNKIRGCLESLYTPGVGYAPIPAMSFIDFDLNSILPGTGAHLACFANAAGIF